MKTVCQYAIVRFLPFLETGEFANVGIIIFAPKTGLLSFKLAPESFQRVTQFFSELDRAVYKKAIHGFEKELNEVQVLAKGKRGEELIDFVKEITRLRESLLRFSELRTAFVMDPHNALEDLFKRYVGRDFINKKYREDIMARKIKTQLATYKLDKQYIKYTFEKNLRKIAFPLVNTKTDVYNVMKPLAFDQKNPSLLIEHAELWRNKIQWLLERDVLREEDVLLPIEKPNENVTKDILEAYDIARKDLVNLNIEVVDFDNAHRIVEFAQEKAALIQPH